MEAPAGDITVNPGEDQPAHTSVERPNEGLVSHVLSRKKVNTVGMNLFWDNRVERLTGMTEEFPELAEFKKNAPRTALGMLDSALLQGFTRGNGSRSGPMGPGVTETVHGQEEQKNPPGQDGHPGQQEYDNILKRGNKSTADSSKHKRVKSWDENPPVLKVVRVQDHYGHATQEHISGKEEHFAKTIREDGQGEPCDSGLARSKREEHRAAEVELRSSFQEMKDLAAARGVELLGVPSTRLVKKGKVFLGMTTLRGWLRNQ